MSEHPFADAALVNLEIAAALERVAEHDPTMDAAQTARQAIGYLAEVHALRAGHAATIKALIAIAKRGLFPANEEAAAPQSI